MDQVLIDRELLADLVADSKFLICLEQAGVEDWDGYPIAEDIYKDGEAE